MCMAIFKPAGKNIPIDYLKTSFASNPHGCGIAFADGSSVTIRKGLWTWEQFLSEYSPRGNMAMLIHFRWATHGAQNETNCHPWQLLNGKLAMIHNGVLPIECADEALSDTGNFAKLVLEPMLASHNADNPALRFLIESAIGPANKIAIMDKAGTAVIYNETSGEWQDGVWFSNSGFRPKAFTYSALDDDWREFTPAKQAKGEDEDWREWIESSLSADAQEREDNIRTVQHQFGYSRIEAEEFLDEIEGKY